MTIINTRISFAFSKVWLFFSFLLTSLTLYSQSTTINPISFYSKKIKLSGTIYAAKNPKAGVVIVHGSGHELRSTALATFLANNGISVLTYDKRGVGESEGEYAGPEVGTNNIDPYNLNLLATDVQAALKTLKEVIKDNNVPVGLMGGSQAGWIIPIAANKYKKTDFIVLLSGPVIPTLEQLRFQFFTNGNPHFWDTHSESEVRQHISNAPDKFRFVNTDPVKSLKKLKIPGLWLFGDKDIQVPIRLSIEKLEDLKAQGKDFDYKIFHNFGHNLSISINMEPTQFAIDWIKSLAEGFNK
ncbi:alpha/beta hydrolase family protein [Sphingobacterium sp. SG20118]|uniref:alpha/beta hydrolase family protein n=1 Tax=Sphingobacterium sp. SG20118 TaxID=3367156 RepID=UPI0037DFC8AA